MEKQRDREAETEKQKNVLQSHFLIVVDTKRVAIAFFV